LGSSSAVTNNAGGVLVSSSFDAFGKRRGSNWTGNPSSGDWTAIAATTRRGYTDHSMLDNVGLIHMNGRVQDPVLGRFTSADPLITTPLFTQNFNRYSYVYNNPLAYIDPRGFDACDGTPDEPSEDEESDSKTGGTGYQNGSTTASGVADCMEEIVVTGRNGARATNDLPGSREIEFLSATPQEDTITVTGRKKKTLKPVGTLTLFGALRVLACVDSALTVGAEVQLDLQLGFTGAAAKAGARITTHGQLVLSAAGGSGLGPGIAAIASVSPSWGYQTSDSVPFQITPTSTMQLELKVAQGIAGAGWSSEFSDSSAGVSIDTPNFRTGPSIAAGYGALLRAVKLDGGEWATPSFCP
jgi:RHS repeat-associated protein